MNISRHTITLILVATAIALPFSASAWEIVGTTTGQVTGNQYGAAIATVDFNNDGYLDIAVGAPAADDLGASTGRVYLYYGGPTADTLPDLVFVGQASSFFGQAIASAGDFNNDGSEDLAVGAPFFDQPVSNAGAVFIFYGGSSPDTTVDRIITGEASNDYFGISVAPAGDFNDDTYADLVIGAWRADWGTESNSGKAYVLYGGPSPDTLVDLTLIGDGGGERLGYSVTGGDFNGDGIDDIAAGAFSYDDVFLNQGRIYLFYGGSSPDSLYDLAITGTLDGEKYGWSLSSGDVNNDTYDDIVMGSDGYAVDTFATGRMYVFHGGPSLDASLDFDYTLGRTENDYLGFSVVSGFDITDDGIDDVVTGMPGNDDGAADAGGAVVIEGGGPTVDTTILGQATSEELGSAVGMATNFQSAGNGLLLIGASDYDNFTGRVFWFVSRVIDQDSCCVGNRGDIDGNGVDADPIDLSFLVDYLFSSGIAPPCNTEADFNADGTPADPIDLSTLVDYLFAGGVGPEPCP